MASAEGRRRVRPSAWRAGDHGGDHDLDPVRTHERRPRAGRRPARPITRLASEAGRQAACAGQLAKLGGAKKGILPAFLEPSLATLADTAPEGAEWIHEIKFDGYRLQARIDGRPGQAPDPKRPRLDGEVQRHCSKLACAEARVGAHRRRSGRGGRGRGVELHRPAGGSQVRAFGPDGLLCLRPALSGGYDLTRVPLIDRKTSWPAASMTCRPMGPFVTASTSRRSGAGHAPARLPARPRGHRLEAQGPALPRRPRHALAQDRSARSARSSSSPATCPRRPRARRSARWCWACTRVGRLVHVGRVGTGFTEAMARRSAGPRWRALKRPDLAVCAASCRPKRRGACAGSSRSSSPRSNCAAGQRTACCVTPPSRACATTRTRPRSCGRRRLARPAKPRARDDPDDLRSSPIPTACSGLTSA